MDRLIDNALIYGAMLEIGDPHMIERYNVALEGFGLSKTNLEKFTIDATGFSPEVAKELDDEDYLNPNGINRRFIILSPEQETLPIVYAHFSSTYDLMMALFRKNTESLRVLTLKDVVFGEIENSTFQVNSISDILSIREIEFKLRTGNQLFEKAERLKVLLDRFFTENDGWQNRQLINDILTLGNLVGDIRYNDIVPRFTEFQQPSFWTSLFGGIYVFHQENGDITVIGHQDKPEFQSDGFVQFKYIPLSNQEAVYAFLLETGRISGLEPDWLRSSHIIDLRSEFLVKTAIAKSGTKVNLKRMNPSETRSWIYRNMDQLSKDGVFSFFNRMQKALRNGILPNLKNTAASLKLMVVRANPDHIDRVLVARMLSHYAPFDFFTKFAVNKQAFYDDYKNLSESMRDFVVYKITNQYFPDRQKFWETLFESRKD